MSVNEVKGPKPQIASTKPGTTAPLQPQKQIDPLTLRALQSVAASEIAELGAMVQDSVKGLQARAEMTPLDSTVNVEGLKEKVLEAFTALKEKYLSESPKGAPGDRLPFPELAVVPADLETIAAFLPPEGAATDNKDLRLALDAVTDAAWTKVLDKATAPPDPNSAVMQMLSSPQGKAQAALLGPLMGKLHASLGIAKGPDGKASLRTVADAEKPMAEGDVKKLADGATKLLGSLPGGFDFATMDLNAAIAIMFMLISKDADNDLREMMKEMKIKLNEKRLKRDELRLLKEDRQTLSDLVRAEFIELKNSGALREGVTVEDYEKFRKVAWGEAKRVDNEVRLSPGKLCDPSPPTELPPTLAAPLGGEAPKDEVKRLISDGEGDGSSSMRFAVDIKPSSNPLARPEVGEAAATINDAAAVKATDTSIKSQPLSDRTGISEASLVALRNAYNANYKGEAPSFEGWLKKLGFAVSTPFAAGARDVYMNLKRLGEIASVPAKPATSSIDLGFGMSMPVPDPFFGIRIEGLSETDLARMRAEAAAAKPYKPKIGGAEAKPYKPKIGGAEDTAPPATGSGSGGAPPAGTSSGPPPKPYVDKQSAPAGMRHSGTLSKLDSDISALDDALQTMGDQTQQD